MLAIETDLTCAGQLATTAVEDVAAQTRTPLWFQLYIWATTARPRRPLSAPGPPDSVRRSLSGAAIPRAER
jgi:hypothetical protein